MKKSSVLASRLLLMVSSVVLSEKYSGGDHHWYKFFSRVRAYLCMDFSGVIID